MTTPASLDDDPGNQLAKDADDRLGGGGDGPKQDDEERKVEQWAMPDKTIEAGNVEDMSQRKCERKHDDGEDQQGRDEHAVDTELGDHEAASTGKDELR